MFRIEVLGPGCHKCSRTYDEVKKILYELNLTVELVKITDVFEIIDRGVNSTPALIVDGQVVLQGKAPTEEEIRSILRTHMLKGNGSTPNTTEI
jgi:small redox-active disulfide protein 2